MYKNDIRRTIFFTHEYGNNHHWELDLHTVMSNLSDCVTLCNENILENLTLFILNLNSLNEISIIIWTHAVGKKLLNIT